MAGRQALGQDAVPDKLVAAREVEEDAEVLESARECRVGFDRRGESNEVSRNSACPSSEETVRLGLFLSSHAAVRTPHQQAVEGWGKADGAEPAGGLGDEDNHHKGAIGVRPLSVGPR